MSAWPMAVSSLGTGDGAEMNIGERTAAYNDPVFMAKRCANLPTTKPDKPYPGQAYRDEHGHVWVWEFDRWFYTSTFKAVP